MADALSKEPLMIVQQTLDPFITKILSGLLFVMALFFLVLTFFGHFLFQDLRYITGLVAVLNILAAFIMPYYLKNQYERIKILFYQDHAVAILPNKREARLAYQDFFHLRYEQSAKQKSLAKADFYFDVPFNMSAYVSGLIIRNVDLEQTPFDQIEDLIKRGQDRI